MNATDPNLKGLRDRVKRLGEQAFGLDLSSIHGRAHWKRVERNGLDICAANGGDPMVVVAFAYLHDCQRWDEGSDGGHGPRAARHVRELWRDGKLPELSEQQMELLAAACDQHTGSPGSDDPTIGACLDADRLDLVRLNRRIRPDLLSTHRGRQMAKETSRADSIRETTRE